LPVVDQFGVAAYGRGDDRQPGGHGFEDGVRDAFGNRGQDETVEPAHDFGDVLRSPGSQARSATPAASRMACDSARKGRRQP
jgi:hypothetical protein